MSGTRQLLDKIGVLLDRRQTDIARLAGRFGVDYAPQRSRDFLGAIEAALAAPRLRSFDTLKVVAGAALLAEDYDLVERLLDFLARFDGAREVDADVVAVSIRAMAIDSIAGHMQTAMQAGQYAQAEAALLATYRFGLPDRAQVERLAREIGRRDPARGQAIERDYRARLERAGGASFEERLTAAHAQRELRAMTLPVYEALVAAGDLARAEQLLTRLYSWGLTEFAPVELLADAYLARDAAPASPSYQRAQALVDQYMHEVGEPLGDLQALDAIRYRNRRLAGAGQ